jgi:hypothetical protein
MVQLLGKAPASIDSRGWSQALKTYRPFLSYGELGGLIEDGPSRLHDAIVNILGLEEFTRIKEELTAKKSSLSAQIKESKAAWATLNAELSALDDPRAQAIVAVTKKRGWAGSSVEALLLDDSVDNESIAGWWRSVLAIAPLPVESIITRTDSTRVASAGVLALSGSDAQVALSTCKLGPSTFPNSLKTRNSLDRNSRTWNSI